MNTKSQPCCQICGEGELSNTTRTNTVEYKGHTKDLEVLGSVCSTCGSEQTNATQTRANKRAMQEFKKEVDGLLTGKEIKELRSRFRITQAQAAKIFGGGPVAFSKYEADDVSQSEPMDKLLRVALSVPGAFAWLSKEAGEMTPCIQAMSESLKQIQNVSKQSYRTSMSNSSFNKPTLSGSSNSPYRSSTGVEDLLEVA